LPWVRRLIGVRRKATIIGILAILLTAATAERTPVYVRAVSSIRNFERNFGDLKKADSLNTLERVVFSLVLTNSKASNAAGNSDAVPLGRT
jgi:hypothetical protein